MLHYIWYPRWYTARNYATRRSWVQCRGISLAQNRQNVHDSCAPGSLDIAHVARSSAIRAFRIGPSPLAFAAPERGGWRRGLSLPLVHAWGCGGSGVRKVVTC